MAHIPVCVLLAKDSASQHELWQKADKVLAEFDSDKECDGKQNPNGHIDAWEITDELFASHAGRLFTSDGIEGFCTALITKDKRWLTGPFVYGEPNKEQRKEIAEWDRKVADLVREPNTAIFIAACHF